VPIKEKISWTAFIFRSRSDNSHSCFLKIIAGLRRATNIVLLCAIFCASCEKRRLVPAEDHPGNNSPLENGLPQNFKRINGYFFSCFIVDSGGFGPAGNNLQMYAAFNDPAANLIPNINRHGVSGDITSNNYQDTGNVSVGNVSFNGTSLNSHLFQPAYYSLTQSKIPEFYGQSKWTTEGNGSFTGIDVEIKRGYPGLTLTPGSNTISGRQSYTVNTAGYFSNCDSVSVLISHNYLNAKVLKTSSRTDTVFVFTVNELAPFKGYTYTTISFEGFNYSRCVANGKIYIFELGRKMRKQMYVQN
jgi:hypothetical protein